MALVNVVNMVVLDNPTCFLNPFQFEITFECLQELDDDLEWKVLYVGSAQDASRDQILDEILVGPVPVGVNKFILQADAPDPTKLAQEDLLGVTVVLVTCSYKEREFVRVGYYVNNEYHNPDAPPLPPAVQQEQQQQDGTEENNMPPPPPPIPNPVPLEHIQRQILADKPRVTKFPISWDDETTTTTQDANDNNNTTDNTRMGTNHQDNMMMMMNTSNNNTAATTSSSFSAMVTPQGGNGGGSSSGGSGGQHDSGVVFMQEESNIDHSHFGVSAMAE